MINASDGDECDDDDDDDDDDGDDGDDEHNEYDDDNDGVEHPNADTENSQDSIMSWVWRRGPYGMHVSQLAAVSSPYLTIPVVALVVRAS